MSSKHYNRIGVISFLLAMLFIPLAVINAQASQALPISNQVLQNIPTPYPGEDGATYDSRVYAAQYGVSVKEAKHRFALQDAAGVLNAQLIAKESTTFAGLWLEHKPQFKIVVQFTGAAKPNIAAYTQNKDLVSLVEMRTANLSLVDIEKAQMKAYSAFANSGMRVEAGLNVQKNHVEIYTLAQDRPTIAAKMIAAQMPAYIDLVTVPALSEPKAEWYGGLDVRDVSNHICTTGFAVQGSGGVKGVITAGHCQNQLYDVFAHTGLPLTFKGESYGGPYEVQWHTFAGYTPVNKIRWNLNGATRYINSVKARVNQVVGGYVCKYGKVGGYGCGTIADKNYLLSYGDPWKPKIPFTATFIRVTGSYSPFIPGGDSGGPWFNGYTAYGITSSGFNVNGVYMAINYISALGVSVMVTPYGPTPVAPRP